MSSQIIESPIQEMQTANQFIETLNALNNKICASDVESITTIWNENPHLGYELLPTYFTIDIVPILTIAATDNKYEDARILHKTHIYLLNKSKYRHKYSEQYYSQLNTQSFSFNKTLAISLNQIKQILKLHNKCQPKSKMHKLIDSYKQEIKRKLELFNKIINKILNNKEELDKLIKFIRVKKQDEDKTIDKLKTIVPMIRIDGAIAPYTTKSNKQNFKTKIKSLGCLIRHYSTNIMQQIYKVFTQPNNKPISEPLWYEIDNIVHNNKIIYAKKL